ncbi:MAG: MerR family transcriptional regulator [Gemmatimonadales bacterium]
MAMRMQELSERSGLPRTTIHHYVREGLLPAARKSAPNAAEYDEAHLERLRLVTQLRGEEAGALSIPEIRRVIELLEDGVALRGAVRLVREGLEPGDASGSWAGPGELAVAAGCPPAFAEKLRDAGLLDGSEDRYTPGDLLVLRACHATCEERGIDPEDLTPLADLIREVGNYSDTLVDVHTVRTDRSAEAATVLRRSIADLCEALLWRSFESTDAAPGS